jgi:hypothetical protein
LLGNQKKENKKKNGIIELEFKETKVLAFLF